MKKNILKSCLLLLTASAFVLPVISNHESEKAEPVKAADRMFNESYMGSIENFVNSGKGFSIEFTFETPNVKTTNKFCFMRGWDRLTTYIDMTFNTDGSVTTSLGKVLKIKDKYFYQIMMSDLKNILNKSAGEVRDGTETLNALYFNQYNHAVDFVSVNIISTDMNMSPVASIKNSYPTGITFKGHLGSIKQGSKYGIIITPYENFAAIKSINNIKQLLDDNTLAYLDLECNPKTLSSSDELYKTFGSGYSISGSLTNIKENNFRTDFVAIGYEKDTSGNYVYAGLISETKNSLYDLSKSVVASNSIDSYEADVKKLIKNVINVCDNHAIRLNTENVKAYFPYNSELVKRDAALPGTLRTEHTLNVTPGENETGQLMLNVTKSSYMKARYYMSFDPFVKEDEPSVVLSPDIASIYQERYINIKTNWQVESSQPSSWYPNGQKELNKPLGVFPDALLPFKAAEYAKENYLDNPEAPSGSTDGVERNNGVYFDIKVPRGTKPGVYTSKIVARIVGEGTIALPVKLNVYNFELPTQNKDKMVISIDKPMLQSLYNGGTYDEKSPIYMGAVKMLEERGISSGALPTTWWQMSDMDKYISYAKKVATDDNISVYYLPTCAKNLHLKFVYKKKGSIFETNATEEMNYSVLCAKDSIYNDGNKDITLPGLETTLTELVKASTNEVDLLKKGIFYYPQADEPGNNIASCFQNILCENSLRRSIDYVSDLDIFSGKEKVKQSLLKLKYIVTSYPRDYLYNFFDTKLVSVTPQADDEYAGKCYCASKDDIHYTHMTGYCPTFESYQAGVDFATETKHDWLMSTIGNDEYANWWYGCIQPINPYPSFITNTDIIRYRENQWCKYMLGIDGELYYICNRTIDQHTDTSTWVSSTTPHTSEHSIFENGIDYEGASNDGLLMYPAHDMYGYVDNSIYWLSTLRLDSFAEGIDDYNYLAYAGELINALPSGEQSTYKTQLDNIIKGITTGPAFNQMDSSVLETQKDALASLIIELLAK